MFKNAAIRYLHAIMLTKEMDKARLDLAPNPDTAVMVHDTYNQFGQVSNKIADWLRDHGYAAHAGHPLGGMALYPPMALAAGLGWGRIRGLLITPEFCIKVCLFNQNGYDKIKKSFLGGMMKGDNNHEN